jgi:hypothetical protein
MISLITRCLVDMVVMGDVFCFRVYFHMPLSLKVKTVRLVELVAIYLRSLSLLCVGMMAIFCGVTSYSGSFSIGMYLLFLSRGVVSAPCGVFACSGVIVIVYIVL